MSKPESNKKPRYRALTQEEQEAGVFQVELYYHMNSDSLFKEVPINIKNQVHGTEVLYRENGQVWSQHPYKHGEESGAAIYFKENGTISHVVDNTKTQKPTL